MPWAQRVTTTVLRLNATYIYCVGKGRLAACNPLQRRVHTQLICSSAHASALSRNQHCCISRPGHKSYSRPTPVCRVSVDAPEPAVSGPSSMTQETVADDLSTSSSSGSLGELADTAYRVVNFYHLVDIPNPFQVIAEHQIWVQGKDLAGRIYLSTQGINAQYSGLTADAEGFAQWLEQQALFKGLRWSSFPVDSHQFPKLRLKFKQNLISLAGGMTRLPVTNPKARATPLAPSQWKQMLASAQQHAPDSQHAHHDCSSQAQATDPRPDSEAETSGELNDASMSSAAARPDVVVLDVRNDYEWDAGHFQGADRPQEENFNETPTEVSSSDSIPSYLQGKAADTAVMMYCTGGIRCDVYSAHLRDKGFTNLYTLEGGIQNYLREEGHQLWDGSLFVFDGRMAVSSGDPAHEGQLVAAAPCAACGHAASLPHMNCANIDCNKLFLACDRHKDEFAGCCSQQCMEAPRLLRPPKQAGYYGNWTLYSSDDEVSKASMVDGRGNGRLARRRKRLEKLRAKEAVAREERQVRKELVKAAIQSRQSSQQPEKQVEQAGARTTEPDAAEQRMARLSLLRNRHTRAQLTSV